MLRLSKKVEYGIIAAQYLAANERRTASAKEIAEAMHLSFDFLSKTLQAMLKTGVLTSQKGVKGGYSLARLPNKISLADIINSLEENTAIAACLSDDDEKCHKEENCSIKNPLFSIQKKIDKLLSNTSIAEITKEMEKLIESTHKKDVLIDLNKVKHG